MMPTKKINRVVISGHILHRSLAIEENSTVHTEDFLGDVLYLSILLEAFVLHDRVVVPEHPNIDEREASSSEMLVTEQESLLRARLNQSQLLGPMVAAKAFTFVEPPLQGDIDENVSVMDELENAGWDPDVYVAECVRDIRLAQRMDYSFVPEQSSYCRDALAFLDLKDQTNLSQLAKAYQGLKTDVRSRLTRLARARNRKMLYVPPIAALILHRAQGVDEVANRAIELRDEFEGIRSTFAEYETRIRDDGLSLQESLDALDELEDALSLLSPRSSNSAAQEVREWRDLTDLTKLLDGVSIDDGSSLAKIALGKPLEILVKKLKTRKVSYLSVFRKNFFRINRYSSLLERVFRIKLAAKHFEALHKRKDASGFCNYLVDVKEP